MANIKDISQSAEKWVRRASQAGPDFEAGIRNPRRAWAEATIEAAPNFKAGVQAAANAGLFEKGVRKAGNAKWQENAIAKGPGRFAEGVGLARDAWQAGFGPFQSAIAALNLPPRGPKGSPANLQRVAAVANALRALKLRGAGA